jgi:hypothetical protein
VDDDMIRETRETGETDDSRFRSKVTSRRTVLRGTLAGASVLAGVGRVAAHGSDEGGNDGDDNHTHDDGDDGEREDEDDEDEDEGGFASVEFDDQTSDGTSVVVDSVAMPEGGFISIHDERFVAADDSVAVGPGSIIGYSRYLDPGTHTNVEIGLFNDAELDTSPYEEDRLDDGVTLIALPHKDTNDNEEWDFYPGETGQDGAYKQGPQSDDSVPLNRITDTAEITVPDDADGESEGDDGDDRDDSNGSDDGGHSHDGGDGDDEHSHDRETNDDSNESGHSHDGDNGHEDNGNGDDHDHEHDS